MTIKNTSDRLKIAYEKDKEQIVPLMASGGTPWEIKMAITDGKGNEIIPELCLFHEGKQVQVSTLEKTIKHWRDKNL